MWWLVASHGQRYVRPSNSAVAWPAPVRVLDFNPYNIRKYVVGQKYKAKPKLATKLARKIKRLGRRLLRQKKQPPPNNSAQRVVMAGDNDGFMSYGVFEEDINSSLPYLECTSQSVFDYDGVLIDEERLVGLRVSSYLDESDLADPNLNLDGRLRRTRASG